MIRPIVRPIVGSAVLVSVCGCTPIATVPLDPPVITTHPASQSVDVNTDATFTVIATGEELTYQWQRNTGSNWVNVSGTQNTLTFEVTTYHNDDRFRCVVSNTSGTVTSNAATLTVTGPCFDTDQLTLAASGGGESAPTINLSSIPCVLFGIIDTGEPQWQYIAEDGLNQIAIVIRSEDTIWYTTVVYTTPIDEYIWTNVSTGVSNGVTCVDGQIAFDLLVLDPYDSNPWGSMTVSQETGP